jgi:hypothetical protein
MNATRGTKNIVEDNMNAVNSRANPGTQKTEFDARHFQRNS